MTDRSSHVNISIRPARKVEKPLLKSMIRAGRLNPLSIDWRRFLVAEAPPGTIVGCIQRKDHSGEVHELASLYVLPRWRRRGIARALVETLMQRTNSPLWLTCRQQLTGFYQQFGFKVIANDGQMPPYFRAAWRLFRILGFALRHRDGLAVMRFDPESSPTEEPTKEAE